MHNKISDHKEHNTSAAACEPMDEVFEDVAQNSKHHNDDQYDARKINNSIEINVREWHDELLCYAVR